MAELSSVISAIRGKSPEDEPANIVGAFAGFGSILGIIAAAIGLFAGISLVPITSLTWELTSISPFEWILGGNSQFTIYSGAFMGLLAVGLLFQALGSKDLRSRLGGMFGSVFYVGFIMAAIVAVFITLGFGSVTYTTFIPTFLSELYLVTVIFVIAWQMISVFYVDSSRTWVGFLAGMMNGLFIPVLALGQALGPLVTYGAYGLLLVGQLMTLVYWWSPKDTIRGFARSPEKAKFAFGMSGFLTFVIGAAAVFIGPLGTHPLGGSIWQPWSTIGIPAGTVALHMLTNPALVYGFLSMMLFWILLSPRLGARELKTTTIGDDIVKGGSKWFAVFMIFMGILAAGQSGVYADTVSGWGFFLVIGPASAMILMGAMYTAKTDIITGFPLVIAGIFTMVSPFSIALLVIVPWILVIVTQMFLMIESYWRGFTGFSQGSLSVIFSILTSSAIIVFMFGILGRGPLALWPTNLWFNISLIPGLAPEVQSSVIIILPFLALLLRNAALAGFSHGRGYTTGGILMGMTVMFSLMIPVIAGNDTVPHMASTGAALLVALYAISMLLILSLNMNLAGDVAEQGHEFEGNLIKFSAIGQVIMGVIMLVFVLVFFSGLPSSHEIALVISIMVTFIVGGEILSIISWFIAGIRLGLLKEGFRIQRPVQ
ncbi:MAG: hypothetical protein E4H14_08855 [Candidatus Thorarchaeota archaeon]|nr:MAG: hypothetical protein E4H14_08855 [Candidatus Thorarchaeota archaeon]